MNAFAERLAGWREAAEEAGLDWDDVVQVDQPLSGRPYGRAASEQLVDVVRGGGRWGVLAMTDALALGVLLGFEESGVRCPHDVARHHRMQNQPDESIRTRWAVTRL